MFLEPNKIIIKILIKITFFIICGGTIVQLRLNLELLIATSLVQSLVQFLKHSTHTYIHNRNTHTQIHLAISQKL